MRPWRLVLLILPALLGPAGAAQAATYCVMKPACMGTAKPSVQDALDAALLPGADRIEIGTTAGFVPPAGGAYLSSDPLEIVGSGRASTLLGGSTTVLSLGAGASSSSVSVSDLAIVVQSGSGTGLRLDGASARRVDVRNESAAQGSTGVELANGAGYQQGTVSLAAAGSVGVSARLGTNGIDDAVVDLGSAPGATGVAAGNASGQTPVILDARHVTVGGGGASNQRGASAGSSASGQTVVLNLTSSVIHAVSHSLVRAAPGGSANINPTYSSYEPAAVLDAGGVGGISSSATNTSADPRFENAPGHDFRLSPTSPLIDAGRPGGLEPDEPPTDLAGTKRILDGNGDCAPRGDMGANELLPGSAAAHASATPGTVQTGRQVTFDASASCDPDPAVGITGYHWSFDDGGLASGPVVNHPFANPGAHFATLTVTSSAGRSGSTRIAVSVNAPPKPATSGAPRKRAKPKLRSFVLIAARPVTLAGNGVASIALRCAGRRRCTGRLELLTARAVSVPLSSRKRVLKLGSSRFSIRGNRRARVRVRLSSTKVRLVEELGRLRTNVTVRDRDSAGRPRKSTRTIVLRAPTG